MKAVFVLSDSLNRHFLPSYGNDWVQAPNIDRLARRSVTFDNHWIGSAPCMPARRDILTGRLNFLEREWSGLEPFDRPFTRLLRNNGIHTHMETDHYHYFHVGGENYHTQFGSWRFHRGQEWDVWASTIRPPEEPEHMGQWNAQYAKNRERFTSESEYPTPRTFQGAVDWLKANEGEDDYFLWIEAFDPHEPFDAPEEYRELYSDDWTGPLYNWSDYKQARREPEAVEHLRRCYAATLTMMDRWLGRLLDELERQGSMEDTLIIFTTDHGHMLGEHGITGKNWFHGWNEMTRIPLLVHLPGDRLAGERRGQLTQNIDIMPTLLDYYGLEAEGPIHGESWMPILEANTSSRRQAALYGWFGQSVNVTDGRCTYFRAPAREDNQPLYRHFLTPGTFRSIYGLHDIAVPEFYDGAELGRFLPYSDFPVLRSRKTAPVKTEWGDNRLYDIREDPEQSNDLCGTDLEPRYRRLLEETMRKMDSPPSQYERLGLEQPERAASRGATAQPDPTASSE